MRIVLRLMLAFFSLTFKVSAADFPFVDVPLGSPYYPSIDTLYQNSIIFDDGSHKFKPEEKLSRDEFIGILLGSSCNACLTPNIFDIVKYQTSPFPDLDKDNPYYYCIARAFDEKIIDGVSQSQDGKYLCENNTKYSEKPFCTFNGVSRITAIVSLLKKANLWNDTQNSQFKKTLNITDVPTEFLGYAEKAIQFGIASIDAEGKLNPNEALSRYEFAKMAAAIFEYNQCLPPGAQNKIGSSILLTGEDGKVLKQSIISKDTPFTLEALTSDNTPYTYVWKAIHALSRAEISEEGSSLPSNKLGSGSWIIELSVLDTISKEKLSASNISLTISLVSPQNLSNVTEIPSLSLTSKSGTNASGGNIFIESNPHGAEPMSFLWDFGDGTRMKTVEDSANGKSGRTMSHTYTSPGIYTVTVVMTDASGKSALGTAVIEVSGLNDADGDGVPDSIDVCPQIKGEDTNKGCPSFKTNIYTKGAFLSSNQSEPSSAAFSIAPPPSSLIAASTTSSSMSTTTPSATTTSTTSASTTTAMMSLASMAVTAADTDNDGIEDTLDACPTTPGNASNGGCPLVGSFLGNIEQNSCIMGQIQKTGGIIIEPICETCPCATSVSMGASLRRCDVIFPAILSKDLLSIYSRGPLFQIP